MAVETCKVLNSDHVMTFSLYIYIYINILLTYLFMLSVTCCTDHRSNFITTCGFTAAQVDFVSFSVGDRWVHLTCTEAGLWSPSADGHTTTWCHYSVVHLVWSYCGNGHFHACIWFLSVWSHWQYLHWVSELFFVPSHTGFTWLLKC